LGNLLIRADKADKDINELWKAHRLFEAKIRGLYNRLIVKVDKKFKDLNVSTDFTSEFYEDEDKT
jgi:hypothetical protein